MSAVADSAGESAVSDTPVSAPFTDGTQHLPGPRPATL